MRSDRESPSKECGLVINAFLGTVKEALRGFGTFKVRHRKARNPRTGEPVVRPAVCRSSSPRDSSVAGWPGGTAPPWPLDPREEVGKPIASRHRAT